MSQQEAVRENGYEVFPPNWHFAAIFTIFALKHIYRKCSHSFSGIRTYIPMDTSTRVLDKRTKTSHELGGCDFYVRKHNMEVIQPTGTGKRPIGSMNMKNCVKLLPVDCVYCVRHCPLPPPFAVCHFCMYSFSIATLSSFSVLISPLPYFPRIPPSTICLTFVYSLALLVVVFLRSRSHHLFATFSPIQSA